MTKHDILFKILVGLGLIGEFIPDGILLFRVEFRMNFNFAVIFIIILLTTGTGTVESESMTKALDGLVRAYPSLGHT